MFSLVFISFIWVNFVPLCFLFPVDEIPDVRLCDPLHRGQISRRRSWHRHHLSRTSFQFKYFSFLITKVSSRKARHLPTSWVDF